jgi:hypothetical protein
MPDGDEIVLALSVTDEFSLLLEPQALEAMSNVIGSSTGSIAPHNILEAIPVTPDTMSVPGHTSRAREIAANEVFFVGIH